MTPHGLDAIQEVSLFLEQDILPTVTAALRSELRAAIKILHSAATELNVMTPLLQRECHELLRLNDESARALEADATTPSSDALRPRLADPALDLRSLFALHEEIQQVVTLRMTALLELSGIDAVNGERSRALLLRYYDVLARHATQRLPWQSVFTAPLDSEVA